MKVLIYVCFILFVTNKVTGQTSEPVCSRVIDFGQCLNDWTCDTKVSRCACFEGEPYCRCNNRKGEFYIDEDCSQRWTIVTFALVASLPGVALAVLVGIIVFLIMLSSNTKNNKENKVNTVSPKEEDLFPGITFASDLNARPAPNNVPMQSMPNRGNSMSIGMRDPPIEGPAQPYSSSNSMQSYPNRTTGGRPQGPYNISGGTRDPPIGGPARPFSYLTGPGETVNNPYARDYSPSPNPYDNRGPSSVHRNDYRQTAPSHLYEDVIPDYSTDRRNSRGGFPRPQVNLQY